MAIQVLPRGLTSGDVLSQGFGTGLQALAQSKMSQMQRNQQMSALSNLTNPNLSPEQRLGLVSLLPEALQRPVLENIDQLLSMGQGPASPFQAQDQNLGEMVGEGEQRAMQQQQVGQQPTIGSLFKSPQRRIQEETLELKKQSQRLKESESEFKQQQSLKPFLDAENTAFKNTRAVQKLAKQMLDIVQKNPSKFDNILTRAKGLAPIEAQKLLIQDPDIREYMAKVTNLVTALAGTRKGQPTNFKIKYEALGKPDISMPLESQISLLENLIGLGDEASQVQDYMESLKNPETGAYPLDIAQRVTKFDRAQEDPLSYPEVFKNGTRYWDDNDVPYIIKNGKWVEVK